MIMKRGVFGGTCHGRTGGGCEWICSDSGLPSLGGSLVCSCPCVSGLIPRCQSYSASKLVYKGKYLRAAERPLVVGPRVPDWNLVNLAVISRSSTDSSVGVWIVGCHIKILIGRHDSLLRQRYDFRSTGGVRPCP